MPPRFPPLVYPEDSHDRELSGFEWAVLLHAGLFAVACSWAFGGNLGEVAFPLRFFGALSAPLLLAGLLRGDVSRKGELWPLVPFLLLNLLVFASTFNPSHREVIWDMQRYLVPVENDRWLPGTPLPEASLAALGWLDVSFLTAFNLYLFVGRRRAFVWLFTALVLNGLALAALGSVQKLIGASGPYLGSFRSPNTYFFSTFLYHNHWGAFVLLLLAAALGLCWHYARKPGGAYRDFWHSPAFLMLLALFFLGASLPLSSSRACTALGLATFAIAFGHWMRRLLADRRRYGRSLAAPFCWSAVAIALSVGAVVWLARPMIEERYEKTVAQIEGTDNHEITEGRLVLYRDVLRLFADRPLFGWGMGSFPHAFYSYNSQDRLRRIHPSVFQDAHSDWLQCLAEHGAIGTLLLAAAVALPLRRSLASMLRSYFARYVLLGCCVVLVLASFEFPFGNPAVQLEWLLCLFAAAKYPLIES